MSNDERHETLWVLNLRDTGMKVRRDEGAWFHGMSFSSASDLLAWAR